MTNSARRGRQRPERFIACSRRVPGAGERGRADRAAAVAAKTDQKGNPDRGGQQKHCCRALPPPPCPPARLLDQQFQISDPLLEIALLLDVWPARRRGHAHRFTTNTEMLL